MSEWTLESELRQKEFAALMERRRRNRTPENSFYQKPSLYRPYNMERCVYARTATSPSKKCK